MLGADRNRLSQAKRVSFQDAGFARTAFGLVGDQHHRHVLLPQPAPDLLVQRGKPGSRIHHEQRGIGAFQGDLRLGQHATGQGLVVLILPAGGVDRLELQARKAGQPHAPVARHTGLIVDQRQPLAHQPVEQCRLADIGASDDHHLGKLARLHGAQVAVTERKGKGKDGGTACRERAECLAGRHFALTGNNRAATRLPGEGTDPDSVTRPLRL